MKRRVIKIGGSLLDMDGIGERFASWIESQENAQNFIIVGGGDIVEAMRTLDRVHRFADSEVHWWCVALLSTTARVASRLLGASLIDSNSDLEHVLTMQPTPQSFIVDVNTFYRADGSEALAPLNQDRLADLARSGLPENWETTSDSIAAYFAAQNGISDLVLLKSKSTDRPTVQEWARKGLVDNHFPEIAKHVESIRLVNFRHGANEHS